MRKPDNSMENEVYGIPLSEQRLGNAGNQLHSPERGLCHTSASRSTGLRVRGWMLGCPRTTKGRLFSNVAASTTATKLPFCESLSSGTE